MTDDIQITVGLTEAEIRGFTNWYGTWYTSRRDATADPISGFDRAMKKLIDQIRAVSVCDSPLLGIGFRCQQDRGHGGPHSWQGAPALADGPVYKVTWLVPEDE